MIFTIAFADKAGGSCCKLVASWKAGANVHVYMRDTEIKVISFDMDGALVARPITHGGWYEIVLQTVQSITHESREAAIQRLLSYNILGTKAQNQGSVTKMMMDLGFSRESWNKFKTKNFDISKYVGKDAELVDLLRRLANRYLLILVSNNSLDAVSRNLVALGVPSDLFANIATYESPPGLKGEIEKYEFLLSRCNATFDQVLALGDKYESDLKPILVKGGSGILLDDYTETKDICRLLLESFNSLKQKSLLIDPTT